MKIYIDGELPKECFDCPCHNGENGNCKILNKYTEYVPKDCPLKPLSDYTKQVREEVVEEIKKRLAKQRTKMQDDTHCYLQSAVHWQDIVAILDQVRGESNVKD